MADRVLVVGTYPPIPLPAAAATVAAVRQAWDDGYDVTVVSPRVSAAHLAVPIAGPLAGRRLANVARHTGGRRLVLVFGPGVPLPEGGPAPVRWAAVAGLRRALRSFEHVTLVRAGADLPEALVAEADRVVDFPVSGSGPPGVTPLGPP